MRFYSRLKGSISLLTFLALVGTFLLSGVLFREHAINAAGVESSGMTKGTLTPFAAVDPMKTTTAEAAADSGSTHTKGALRNRPAGSSNQTPLMSTLSQLSNTSSLLEGFNCMSSRDSANTNFGAEFEPPDQGLWVGNGFVVEPVNSAFTIYRADGSVVQRSYQGTLNKRFAA